jgi:hypothetical protein
MGRLSYRWLYLLTCLGILLSAQSPARAGTLGPSRVSGLTADERTDNSSLSWAVLTSLVCQVAGSPTAVVGEPAQSLSTPVIRGPSIGNRECVEPGASSVSSWLEDIERKLLREGHRQGSRTTVPTIPPVHSVAGTTCRLGCPWYNWLPCRTLSLGFFQVAAF